MKVALMPNQYNRVDLFEEAGFEVLEGSTRTTAEMIDLLKDADGALVNTLPLTSREVLAECPKLKVVSRMGVGVDSIDLDAATELGILACNVPGVNTTEVADHAVAMLLALTRRLSDAIATTRAGEWSNNRPLTGEYQRSVRRIAGHTVGIIGFGNIGRAFATRIRGFGPAEVIAYDPYVPQTAGDLYGVRMVDFEELLSNSDYITIHCSATEETRHMIDSNSLGKMKPTAMIVNTARGPLVDGTALNAALRSGQIEAAALDVTEVEPIDAADPLLELPNLIVTPHIAGFSPVFLEECPILQAQNVIRVLKGQAPHGLANPEVIKTIAVMRASDPGRWDGVADFSTALAV
ncbi:MAG: C-terminal binding protein [Gammaproteobacteria bacterium]|nr:C-terminal binding protein [Gammaproteobacteria bacterium]